jgi:hypothetical protein
MPVIPTDVFGSHRRQTITDVMADREFRRKVASLADEVQREESSDTSDAE